MYTVGSVSGSFEGSLALAAALHSLALGDFGKGW
jgi:hypothetical protein